MGAHFQQILPALFLEPERPSLTSFMVLFAPHFKWLFMLPLTLLFIFIGCDPPLLIPRNTTVANVFHVECREPRNSLKKAFVVHWKEPTGMAYSG